MQHLSILLVTALGVTALAACDEPAAVLTMDSSVVLDSSGRVPDLICPGARGCGDNQGPLFVGAAARSITPDPFAGPVWMAGFGMGRRATGIHDDQWARALSLRKGTTRVGIVGLDLVGFQHDDVVRLRQAVADLDFDHILVASTHNHEAKDTIGIWGENVGATGYDASYRDEIIARASDGLRAARDSEAQASLTVAAGGAPTLVHDSRLPELLDPSVYALRFDALAGGTIASLIVWGNHPEALGSDNTLLTSDYPHYIRETFETHYPGSVALFLAGNVGGLANPLHVVGCPDDAGNPTCHNGDFAKAAYLGEGAAAVALAALDGGTAQRDAEPALTVRRIAILGTASTIPLSLGVLIGLIPRVLFVEGERREAGDLEGLRLIDLIEGRAQFQTEVNALRIGPAELLTIPGELYNELWLARADGSSYAEVPAGADRPNGRVLPPFSTLMPQGIRIPINLGNDELGYILPETQWDAEEPHAYVEGGQYGEGFSAGPEIAAQLVEAIERLYALTPR